LPDSVLSVLKYVFLAFLYLFFLRVLRAVWVELREPKTIEVAGAPQAAPAGPPPQVRTTTAESALTTATPAVRADPGGHMVPASRDRLVVTAPPGLAGMSFGLDEELTVGRSPGCGVSLPEDTFVSSVHARVFKRGDEYYVEDLGSTNGTFVNGQRLEGPTHLQPGDQFQVGQTILELDG
jgi:pSer/pThr/pTyr-binding forkhead associated (FHA) protein